MNRKLMNNLIFLLIALFTIGITGCEPEGNMEKAGKEIDEAVKDIGKAAEKTMNDAGKAVEDVQQKVEETIKEQKEN